MEVDESLRVLMLGPAPTADEVRRAYLDLVRVWHPDRFQSDPRLRQIAEERLIAINQAYTCLRGGVPPPVETAQTTARPDANEPRPPQPPPARVTHRPYRYRFRWRLRFPVAQTIAAKLAYGCIAGALCLAPLAGAAWWARFWRVSIPGVPAVDAHGIPLGLSDQTGAPAGSDPAESAPAVESKPAKRSDRRQPKAPAAIDVASLRNGAELLPVQPGSGAGELHVINRTQFSLIAGLVRNKEMVREIYVAPGSAASMLRIRVGVYRVLPEAGTELDAQTLRFHRSSIPAN